MRALQCDIVIAWFMIMTGKMIYFTVSFAISNFIKRYLRQVLFWRFFLSPRDKITVRQISLYIFKAIIMEDLRVIVII